MKSQRCDVLKLGMTRWKEEPSYPKPGSPVHRLRKFSAVLGTTSAFNSISMRPAYDKHTCKLTLAERDQQRRNLLGTKTTSTDRFTTNSNVKEHSGVLWVWFTKWWCVATTQEKITSEAVGVLNDQQNSNKFMAAQTLNKWHLNSPKAARDES